MSSGKSSRAFIPFAVFLPLLLSAPLSLPQEAERSAPVPGSENIPFTIEHADHYFQRRDSSGADRYFLQGAVKVSRRGSRIECASLTYFPELDYVLCLDSVRASDRDRNLSSDSLLYFVSQAEYRALGNVRWSTAEFSGSGCRGDYYRNREELRVTGEAVAGDSLHEIRADTLEYDFTTETLRARGRVELLELKTGSRAEASGAVYRRASRLSTLTGRPKVTYFGSADSLKRKAYHLTGDLLKSYANDSLCAAGRVRLQDDSLSITADSLFHDRAGGRSYFRGGPPRVEDPHYSLTGGNIDISSSGRALERIEAFPGARGEFYLEKGAKELKNVLADSVPVVGSWIEGDTLKLFFAKGTLDSIAASGQARSYFRESAEAGVNYLQGARILLVWKAGALELVEVVRGGRGLYLPADSSAEITVIPDSAGFKASGDSLKK
ncbi:MAG: hypothetical protein A3F83_03710 [Candidatus Glassbacteria bacterium RIFCSPLOWO2_12_FULL_58_11]|uniref:Organic solvent tolerance-like N-terminal domain-containing protein n=1 Tax=Candidatus Glassbacteria bacterium RIFCSPLOWO2_12_FULL_58_11 TaxID=1817867 RepID=A0A1F5YWE2_9BACT|nr:MAG: hypothetical protein A3F83_03710 [Candidatus Glassbacteria bacterium RIFCSPLOWO2_12_FULL_58_11]